MSETTPSRRTARMNRDAQGQPLGVAVFLTADDLLALGVSVESTDLIVYTVVDGRFRATSAALKEVHNG
ncbi:hypothetical protein [Halomarina ordinaria]|uniref:Uncharacterized protein n=1 Tax=Halomarina ordinaria TaxID=3033939 RepID=A0ABD5UA50_9EURY|nr:hypothetical protein [Halomarina sp. PSRA2]